MKILSIKWNPHYVDRNFNGESLGKNFKFSQSIVRDSVYSKSNHEYCKEIIEESLSVYNIHFWDGQILRVFNPIEVEMSEEPQKPGNIDALSGLDIRTSLIEYSTFMIKNMAHGDTPAYLVGKFLESKKKA